MTITLYRSLVHQHFSAIQGLSAALVYACINTYKCNMKIKCSDTTWAAFSMFSQPCASILIHQISQNLFCVAC